MSTESTSATEAYLDGSLAYRKHGTNWRADEVAAAGFATWQQLGHAERWEAGYADAQQVASLTEPGNTVAGWHAAGVAAAQAHATTPSLRGFNRSILSDAQYAQDMSDRHAAEGDVLRAAYWAGYSAEAHRLDPNGERHLLSATEVRP